MRRLLPVSAVGIACSAAISLLSPAAHAADDPISINLGNGWVHDSAAPLFHEARIVPGWSTTRTLLVRNNTDAPMALGISAADIVDSENGCTHAESIVDNTCGSGPDQGELGREMIVSVFVDPTNTGSVTAAPTWTGTLRGLLQVAALDSSVPAHAISGVRITTQLPWTSGNETQTDSVSFGLRLDAEDAGGVTLATAVLGQTFAQGADPTAAGADHPTSVLGEVVTAASLPFTGTYAVVALPVGLALVAAGVVLWLGATRVRRHERPSGASADLGNSR